MIKVQNERPQPVFVPLPTQNELAVFYSLGLLSVILGSVVAWGLYLGYMHMLIFTGVAHLFVFGGLLWFVRLSRVRSVVYVVLCLLFPIWGTLTGICGFYVVSALLCSTLWGCVLWYFLNDQLAFFSMLCIGILLAIGFVLASYYNMHVIPDWLLPGQIGLWHTASAGMVIWLGQRNRKRLARTGPDYCSECGYSLIGLDMISDCPECGKARVFDLNRDGNNWSVSD